MTLGNRRANGVRSVLVSCWICHHGAVLSSGIVGADARPNWKEQPPWRRPSAYNGAKPERFVARTRGRIGKSSRRGDAHRRTMAPGQRDRLVKRRRDLSKEHTCVPKTPNESPARVVTGCKTCPLAPSWLPYPRSQVGAIHPKAMPMILRTEQERGWCGRCSVAAAATVRIVGYRPQRLCREAVGGIGFWHGRGRCGRFGRLGPGVFCGRGTADSPEATDPTAGPSCSNPTSLSWPRPASRSGLPYRRASWRRAVPRYG
jgi:hypothetical protein